MRGILSFSLTAALIIVMGCAREESAPVESSSRVALYPLSAPPPGAVTATAQTSETDAGPFDSETFAAASTSYGSSSANFCPPEGCPPDMPQPVPADNSYSTYQSTYQVSTISAQPSPAPAFATAGGAPRARSPYDPLFERYGGMYGYGTTGYTNTYATAPYTTTATSYVSEPYTTTTAAYTATDPYANTSYAAAPYTTTTTSTTYVSEPYTAATTSYATAPVTTTASTTYVSEPYTTTTASYTTTTYVNDPYAAPPYTTTTQTASYAPLSAAAPAYTSAPATTATTYQYQTTYTAPATTAAMTPPVAEMGGVGGYRLVPALDVPPGNHPNDAGPSQWFEIIRPGNGPIRIGRVSSTCVCVGVRVPNRHIAAGERALIEARTLTRTPVRNITYGIYVNIQEPEKITLDSDILIP